MELEQWQAELDKLRGIHPSVAVVKTLKEKEVPAVKKQLEEETARLTEVVEQVEQVRLCHTGLTISPGLLCKRRNWPAVTCRL